VRLIALACASRNGWRALASTRFQCAGSVSIFPRMQDAARLSGYRRGRQAARPTPQGGLAAACVRVGPVMLVSVVLLAGLTWPLLFTYSGFAGDWEHHLWLMWHQSLAIRATHLPSLFLESEYSVFYPTYAFYGGTIYAIGGLLSLALGESPVQAYVLVFVFDFIAAFGGWYWLARSAGVGRWPAIVPGLIFVTSAYYLVVIYVQGDWPEFTGISMIPLMLAAGLSVLRAERLSLRSALALALSAILFFGSHNLTILLASTTVALLAIGLALCVPQARRSLTRKGIARVAAITVPAAMVSAWYLLPVLAYNSRTRLGSEVSHARESLRDTVSLVSLSHLFTFSRSGGPGLPAPYYLTLALPALAIAWVLAGALLLSWHARTSPWTRVMWVCAAVGVLVCIVMTHAGILLALPRPYTLMQFSYRLETYVLLALCATIVAALVLARDGPPWARIWSWLALPVCAVSLIGAVAQLTGYPYPGQDRYETLQYFGQVETGNNQDFQDVSAPSIPGHGLRTVAIPAAAASANHVAFAVRARPGTLLATNIGAGSYFLNVTGATPAGVDSETGNMVLRVTSAGGRITVSAGHSLPVVLGRLLSFTGLAILLVESLVLAIRRITARSETRTPV
jgi:hypothetical protein